MPVVEGKGISEYTVTKARHFEDIARMHVSMSAGIISSNAWVNSEYTYLDLFAGDGANAVGDEQIDGSPVIMARQLAGKGISRRGFCFEVNKHNAEKLRQRLTLEPSFHVVEGNHHYTIDDVVEYLNSHPDQRPRFGMVYVDPNASLMPSALLRKLYRSTKSFEKVDCVTYLSACVIKRVNGAHGNAWEAMTESLKQVGKRHIHIRVPEGQWQWTMVILTNYADFPLLTRQGFYPLCSQEGQAVVHMLEHTASQLKESKWEKPDFITNMQQRYAELRRPFLDRVKVPSGMIQPTLPLFEEGI